MQGHSWILALALGLTLSPGSLPLGGHLDDEISQEELEAITAQIRGEIEALRGRSFEREVRVSVADEDEFRAYALERMEEGTTPEQQRAYEEAFKLLGLIPTEMDLMAATLELLEEQVGGFYDPSTETFFLMSSFSGDLARIILAHELTHALDDQLFDIDGSLEALADNADATFAYSAVVEGSGTALMNGWTLKNFASLDMNEIGEGMVGLDSLGDAPPLLWMPLLGAYLKGAAFLSRTESVLLGQAKMPRLEDLDRAFSEPPRSSEQILHPEKYWDPKKRDDPRAVSVDVQGLADGWEVLLEDTLGELGIALVTTPPKKRKRPKNDLALLSLDYTNRAAEGWGGDRYLLLGRGEARVLFFCSVWDRDRDAREATSELEGLSDHFESAARARAQAVGADQGGFRVELGEAGDTMTLLFWSAVGRAEVEQLAETLRVQYD